MAEFMIQITKDKVHRLEWEYIAFSVEYLVLTHDGVNERRTDVGAVGVAMTADPGYWGEYNATGEQFLKITKADAKAAVETAHAIYSAQESA